MILKLGIHVNNSNFSDITTFKNFLKQCKLQNIAFELTILNKMNLHDFNEFNIFPHGNMRLNLASPKINIRKYSINVINQECKILESFGVNNIIIHPGSTINLCDKITGINLLADSLNTISNINPNITILVENMCGSGGQLCADLTDFSILKKYLNSEKIKICFDTCHAFGFGYELFKLNELINCFKYIKQYFEIGLIHFNDSKEKLGSKKDKHEHWGLGHITQLNFLSNCLPWLSEQKIPFILESKGGIINWKEEINLINEYQS